MIETKKCPLCQEVKSIDQYYIRRNRKSGYIPKCKSCLVEYRKRFVHKNAPNKLRENHLKWEYGMTMEDYDRLFERQKGLCAICLEPEVNNGHLSVDHNHKTGKIRGLLCRCCNRSLGQFKDSIEILQRAIDYIKEQ